METASELVKAWYRRRGFELSDADAHAAAQRLGSLGALLLRWDKMASEGENVEQGHPVASGEKR